MRYFWFVVLFFIVAYLVPLAGRPLVTPELIDRTIEAAARCGAAKRMWTPKSAPSF